VVNRRNSPSQIVQTGFTLGVPSRPIVAR
jgi:hypothetical protein